MIRQAINSFDAAAGGPVGAQQTVLLSLVSPGQTTVQRHCPVATSTITFDPVYARLAPAPTWRPGSGTLPGTVYALPTLIRIYTGNRITGTDLTDLHVAIADGRARLPALCLT